MGVGYGLYARLAVICGVNPPASQQSTDLPHLKTFPGFLCDEVTHRLARPQREGKFELLGSLVGNEMADLPRLGRIELGASRFTPPSGTCQRLDAAFPVIAKPSTNRAAMHFAHLGVSSPG